MAVAVAVAVPMSMVGRETSGGKGPGNQMPVAARERAWRGHRLEDGGERLYGGLHGNGVVDLEARYSGSPVVEEDAVAKALITSMLWHALASGRPPISALPPLW